MDKLYGWKAKRAGGGISITHSCGKITGISEITADNGRLVARGADGRSFELIVAIAS